MRYNKQHNKLENIQKKSFFVDIFFFNLNNFKWHTNAKDKYTIHVKS